MMNEKLKSVTRGGSVAVVSATALLLAVVAASAAAIVGPLPDAVPAGTEVSPMDNAGMNILVPASTAMNPRVVPESNTSVERAVEEWFPTGGPGGGGSGGGSKKG